MRPAGGETAAVTPATGLARETETGNLAAEIETGSLVTETETGGEFPRNLVDADARIKTGPYESGGLSTRNAPVLRGNNINNETSSTIPSACPVPGTENRGSGSESRGIQTGARQHSI